MLLLQKPLRLYRTSRCESLYEPGLQTSGCYEAWRSVKLEEDKKKKHVIFIKCQIFRVLGNITALGRHIDVQ